MKKKWVVVIDGPSGAGKSTVGQRLARKLGYTYLDTGALYRCVALAAFQKDIPPVNSRRLYDLARNCRIRFKKADSGQQIFLNRKDVTKKIRAPKVSMLASQYSGLPVVRGALRYQQQLLGKNGGIVAEGRDLGTVVFPKAECKFFMSAALRERSRRRYLELRTKARKPVRFEDVRREVHIRDLADMTRSLAPLKKAKDAIEIDTTSLTIDQVIERMYRYFQKKCKKTAKKSQKR